MAAAALLEREAADARPGAARAREARGRLVRARGVGGPVRRGRARRESARGAARGGSGVDQGVGGLWRVEEGGGLPEEKRGGNARQQSRSKTPAEKRGDAAEMGAGVRVAHEVRRSVWAGRSALGLARGDLGRDAGRGRGAAKRESVESGEASPLSPLSLSRHPAARSLGSSPAQRHVPRVRSRLLVVGLACAAGRSCVCATGGGAFGERRGGVAFKTLCAVRWGGGGTDRNGLGGGGEAGVGEEGEVCVCVPREELRGDVCVRRESGARKRRNLQTPFSSLFLAFAAFSATPFRPDSTSGWPMRRRWGIQWTPWSLRSRLQGGDGSCLSLSGPTRCDDAAS